MKLTQRRRISGKARRLYHLERQRRLWAHDEIEDTLVPPGEEERSTHVAPIRYASPLLTQVSAIGRAHAADADAAGQARMSLARPVSPGRPGIGAPSYSAESAAVSAPAAPALTGAARPEVIRPARTQRGWSVGGSPLGGSPLRGETPGGRQAVHRVRTLGRDLAWGVLLGTAAALAALILIWALAG